MKNSLLAKRSIAWLLVGCLLWTETIAGQPAYADDTETIAYDAPATDVQVDAEETTDETYDALMEEAIEEAEGGLILTPKLGNYRVNGLSDREAAALPDAYLGVAASDESYDSVNYDDLSSTQMPTTRDQGVYGACWAFASIANIEFSMVQQGLATASVDYNELIPAYFNYATAVDPLGGTSGDSITYLGSSILDLGGSLDNALCLFTRWVGVQNESTLSYSASAASVQKNGLSAAYAYRNDVLHVKQANVYAVNLKSENEVAELKSLILKYGAVTTCWYAPDDETDYNASNNCYYPSVQVYGANHAVAIVGWDDNFSASNFNSGKQPSTNGAWLIRNSWSSTAEQSLNSYFWVSYEDASIGYMGNSTNRYFYTFDATSASEEDNNYQYDGLTDYYYCGMQTAANVFTAKSGSAYEVLKEVSFLVEDTNYNYTVQVYTNLSSTSAPTDGVLAASVSGTVEYAGYHLVSLGEQIQLRAGERFAIVVTTDSSYGISREYAIADDPSEGLYYSYGVTARTSYYKSGGNWFAVHAASGGSGYGNFCIKAYTSNATVKLPGAATGLGAQISGSSISDGVKLTWTAAASNAGYVLYRNADGGAYTQVATLAATDTSYVDSGLTVGTTYNYVLLGTYTSNGTKYVSTDATSVYEEASLDTPTLKKATNTENGIRITWAKVSGAKHYKIYRKSTSATYWTLVRTNGTKCEWTDKMVKNGKTYMYTVRAVGKDANGAQIESGVSSNGLTMLYLKQTNIKSATADGNRKVTIKWKKNAKAGGYQIKYKTGKKTKTVCVKKASTVKKVLKKLKANKTYKIYVRCYKKSGSKTYYSAWSDMKKVICRN